MLLVRQASNFDCGVAVAAMVGNIPYDRVLDRLITGLSPANSLSELVMWRTLQDISQLDWKMKDLRKTRPRVREFRFPDSPTAIVIERANLSRHYVAVLGNWIFDPLLECPVLQEDYCDGDSTVITTFIPKSECDLSF